MCCRPNRRHWHCDVIFGDCNCTSKLTQSLCWLVNIICENYPVPPSIYCLASKKRVTITDTDSLTQTTDVRIPYHSGQRDWYDARCVDTEKAVDYAIALLASGFHIHATFPKTNSSRECLRKVRCNVGTSWRPRRKLVRSFLESTCFKLSYGIEIEPCRKLLAPWNCRQLIRSMIVSHIGTTQNMCRPILYFTAWAKIAGVTTQPR